MCRRAEATASPWTKGAAMAEDDGSAAAAADWSRDIDWGAAVSGKEGPVGTMAEEAAEDESAK